MSLTRGLLPSTSKGSGLVCQACKSRPYFLTANKQTNLAYQEPLYLEAILAMSYDSTKHENCNKFRVQTVTNTYQTNANTNLHDSILYSYKG